MLQLKWIDVPRKYPPTTLPFQLEKKFYAVLTKIRTLGGEEKASGMLAERMKSRANSGVCMKCNFQSLNAAEVKAGFSV